MNGISDYYLANGWPNEECSSTTLGPAVSVPATAQVPSATPYGTGWDDVDLAPAGCSII